ncbi:hypothetical protein FOZ60_002226 [Perkinsus olseni]|uniref:Uncharacterized protein n=1 Tax=Perkinsus olseni TaxID=32597 RepID=A0A7J6NYF9_PEROL|nr:hypothetical protein FOZ60_002226 [Perkinsus olseni]
MLTSLHLPYPVVIEVPNAMIFIMFVDHKICRLAELQLNLEEEVRHHLTHLRVHQAQMTSDLTAQEEAIVIDAREGIRDPVHHLLDHHLRLVNVYPGRILTYDPY